MNKKKILSAGLILWGIASIPLVKAESEKDTSSYVTEMELKKGIDCDNGRSNDYKQDLYFRLFQGKRVIFTNKVLITDMDTNEVVLAGMLGTGVFSGMPTATFRDSQGSFVIKEDHSYKFDCEIANYCEDGVVLDGSLKFKDCVIVK